MFNIGTNILGPQYGFKVSEDTASPPAPPVVLSAIAISPTEIQFVFDQNMNVSILGWSFKKNGLNLNFSAVSGALTTWIFTTDPMASGNIILYSYDSVTGNTVSAITGIELVSATDQPVTNSIPLAIGITVSSWYGIDGNNINTVTTPDRTTTDNSFIMIGIVQFQSTVNSISDSYGNTWVQVGVTIQPGFYMMWYECTTFNRGANHNFTVSQNISFASVFVVEILGNQPSIDVNNLGNISTPPPTFESDTINTNINDEILLSFASCNDGGSLPYTITWDLGFTNLLSYDRTDGLQGAIGYRVVNATGAYKSGATGVIGVTTFGFFIAGIKDN